MATRVRGGGASGASGTNPSVTLGGAPAQGNLLVAAVNSTTNTAQVLSAANGYAKLTEAVQGNRRTALFWKIAGASEGTSQAPCTWDIQPAWGCYVSEWSATTGWPANPLSIDNSQAVAATTAYTTPSVNPPATFADGVIAAAYGATSAARTWSSEAFTGTGVGSVTEDGDSGGGALATAALTSADTGAYQGSATCSASTAGWAGVALFKAATKAPPPPRRVPRIWTRWRAA